MKLNEIWETVNASFQKDKTKAVAIKIDWLNRAEIWIGLKPPLTPFFAVEIKNDEAFVFDETKLKTFISFEIEIKDNFKKQFIEVKLKNEPSYDLFLIFMQDILTYSESSSSSSAASSILQRIYAWERFFEKGKLDTLSKEELIGLWGELLFIESILMRKPDSSNELISGWQSKSGIDKDFRLSSKCIEIKTTTRKRNTRFSISSELQLSYEELPLYLFGYVLSPDSKMTRTIGDLVHSCRSLLSQTQLLYLFNTKLLSIGYIDEHNSLYEEYRFGTDTIHIFKVNQTFPSITPSKIPLAISSVTYELDPLLCSEWLSNFEEVVHGIN